MSKHTPGPWAVRNKTEVFCGRKRVAHVNAASKEPLNMKQDREVAEANARLIAAAPDLLEALKDALCALECCGKDYPAASKAHATIAKATGEKC